MSIFRFSFKCLCRVSQQIRISLSTLCIYQNIVLYLASFHYHSLVAKQQEVVCRVYILCIASCTLQMYPCYRFRFFFNKPYLFNSNAVPAIYWMTHVRPLEQGVTKSHKMGTTKSNQRTNGPVNAHLISLPSKSTKYTKPVKYIVKKGL